MLIQPLTTK